MSEIPRGLEELPITLEGHQVYPRDTSLVKEVLKIINPTSIFEIGFNVGHSALGWLEWSDANLLSIDIGIHRWEEGVKVVSKYFKERFEFIKVNSINAKNFLVDRHFDMVYLDGSHSRNDVENDIQLSLDLNIEYILFDDHHNEVKRASTNYVNKGLITLIREWKDPNPRLWGLYKNESK